MIVSNDQDTSVEVVLSGATTTAELQCTAHYLDVPTSDFRTGVSMMETTGATPITLVDGVSSTYRREVKYLSVYNSDSVTATVTVRMNDGTDTWILIKVILPSGYHLIYNEGSGWEVLNDEGVAPVAGSGSFISFTTATVNTTDATVTTLQTIAIPLDSGLVIEANIRCRKTSGAGVGTTGDVNGYKRWVKAKNVAGVVTIGIVASSETSEDIAPFNASFDVSGTNVRVRVTGSANNNVTWETVTITY